MQYSIYFVSISYLFCIYFVSISYLFRICFVSISYLFRIYFVSISYVVSVKYLWFTITKAHKDDGGILQQIQTLMTDVRIFHRYTDKMLI